MKHEAAFLNASSQLGHFHPPVLSPNKNNISGGAVSEQATSMEGLNACLGWPLNQDLAIRRFCPARAELDQDDAMNEIETHTHSSFSPYITCIDTINTNLAASEVDDLVDSFINIDDVDQHNTDGDNNDPPVKESTPNEIIDEFSLMLDDGDDQVVEMMKYSSSCEDLGDDVAENVNVPSSSIEEAGPSNVGVDQGLHLVHLLLACAEAVGCRDAHLADTMLAQISASLNPWGDSLHRVACCFAMGLKARLSLFHSVNSIAVFSNLNFGAPDFIRREDKLEAFHLLHQTTPYVAFGFLAANEAICQASQGKDSLHIIDLGMEHTLQFPSLMRTLASRPEGPPKIRITGLIEDQNPVDLEAAMRSLVEEATSLGMSLEFSMVSDLITPSLLTRDNLNLREGEALFINSIMRLHKYVKESRGSLKAILQAIKKLGPTLLTVVEQDANHNGPFFLGRFLESLHYYSAIFDSLEASLPRNSPSRMKIERLHFVEEICNIVAYEGSSRIERHERADQWRRQLGRAGYQVAALKCLTQAKMMLSVYGCDGYTLASEKGCVLLGWKGRPIMLASAWQVHPTSSS